MPSPLAGTLTVVGTAVAIAFGGPNTGALSLEGLQPLLVPGGAHAPATPGAGSISITGSRVAVAFTGPASGSLSLAGLRPELGYGNPQPPLGTLSLAGLQPQAVPGGNNIGRQPTAGALALTGSYAEIDFIGPEIGALSLTGLQPLAVPGNTGSRLPGAGALTVNGPAPNLILPPSPLPASLAVTGQAVVIGRGHAPLTGVLALNGAFPQAIRSGAIYNPATGALTLSTQSPSAPIGGSNIYTLGGASLALTGHAPSLAFGVDASIPSLDLIGRYRPDVLMKGVYNRRLSLKGRVSRLTSGGYAQFTTYAADALVDSIGVNIRVSYYDTPYGDFASTKAALIALGVRHIRDGVLTSEGVGGDGYYSRHAQLGSAGIDGLYVCSIGHSQSDITTFASRVSPTLEALEGPNEWDLNGGVSWAADLAAYLPTVRAAGTTLGVTVVGPSLTTDAAYTTLGSQTAQMDASCLHNYYGNTNHPEHGSITQALVNANTMAPGKPIYTTENGWYTDSALTDYLSEAAHAKYVVRMLLEQFRRGIARTYIHELIDFDNASTPPPVLFLSGYGLLRDDFTPKPAYTAVQSLIGLLSDVSSVTVVNMAYALTGGDSDLRALPFQKQDGSYWLALWSATSGTSSQMVSLSVTGRIVNTHQFQADGSIAVTAYGGVSAATLTVTDAVQVVEVRV